MHPLSRGILTLALCEELCSFPEEPDTDLHRSHNTQHFADKASDASGAFRWGDFLTGQY